MEEIRSEVIGDRRVSLVLQSGDYYAVTIEVRRSAGWQDISLRAIKIWRLRSPAGASASVWPRSRRVRWSGAKRQRAGRDRSCLT
jgi:hypothetical protein